MRHRYSILFFPLHVIVDLLGLNASFVGAYWIKFQTIGAITQQPYVTLWGAVNLIWLVEILVIKPYVFPRQLFKLIHLLNRLFLLIAVHIALIAIYCVAVKGYYYSREHLFITYILFTLIGSLCRLSGILILGEYRARGYNIRRYIIVGYGKLSASIHSFYETHPEMGFKFYGYFDNHNEENAGLLRGTYDNLNNFIETERVDCVYCCMPYIDSEKLKIIVDKAESVDYQVKLLVDFRGFMSKGTSIEYHDFLPVLNISSQMLTEFRVNILKRTFDILFSIGIFLLGLPIFIMIAFITSITSPGPIFYAQERIGRNGKPFMIYKFRSMYVDAESAGPALSGGLVDPRITSWGRFMRQTRLDEIPQFFNVLKGDMSIVGPRPERQYFIDQITEIAPEYSLLLRVKPGITSIGQIKFGYAANVEEMVQRLRFDLLYPSRRSFLFDMWIIAQTVWVMVQGRGK